MKCNDGAGREEMRARTINEKYYALNNQPSFPQLKKDFHLSDEEGRQYWIAQENGDTFQNKNLRTTPDTGIPKISSNGDVTLYVKLAKKSCKWFGENDIGRELVLVGRVDRDEYDVVLTFALNGGLPGRRSGTIMVQGLDLDHCETLISNNSIRPSRK